MIAPARPRGGTRPLPSRPFAAALELGALGVGLTFTVSLMARVPSWLAELGTFQGLFAAAFGFYAFALLGLRRFASLPRVGWWVFAVALAARAALVPVTPSLSDDLYRYVWEGRVAAHGLDPYRASPNDPRLAALRDRAVHPRINHRELASIYPPLGMAGFALVASVSDSPLAMKLWIVLHDLLLVGVLLAWLARRGDSPAAAIAYAWNPLVLVEYAGSGHSDPTSLVWLALALALAERRPVLSALSLSVGALVKLAPLVALPALLARWPWRARLAALAAIGAGLAWFLGATRGPASGLDAYASTWRNNELGFLVLERLAGERAARVLAAGLVLAAALYAVARAWSPERAAQLGARTAALVTPVLHPWYLGWVLMLEPLTRSAPWLVLSLTIVMSYGLAARPAEGLSFHLPLPWRVVEYGIPLVLGLAWAWRQRGAGHRAEAQ